jgi:hypothetical protein
VELGGIALPHPHASTVPRRISNMGRMSSLLSQDYLIIIIS